MRFVMVLLSCVLVLSPFQVFAMSNRVEKSDLVGKFAPDFHLPLLKGGEASLVQLRNAKPSILFFWATWCPHCHEELARLTTTLPALEAKGIQMILVNTGEEAAKVKSYFESKEISLDVVLDSSEVMSGPYNLIGVPTFVFIDSAGIVKNVTHELPENPEKLFE